MKLSIIFALVAVAAATSYNTEHLSVVYKPGEEYVYHYKGQVLSGMPKSSKQFAGLFIDTIVVLQFQQDYKVVMKLEKVKLFKINEKISTLPSELLPESDLTRLTGEQAEIMTEFLVKPLKFKYEEGEVRELEKESRDRFWSVNIKKGILSLFQITLREKSSQLDSSLNVDSLSTRSKHSSRFSSQQVPYWKVMSNKANSNYKVMEADVTGDCENKYTVVSDKTHHTVSSTPKMFVTVVRNFENCQNRPFYIQGLFQGVYRYPMEKNLIQPMVHTDYVITGDRSHFLIREVTLHGKYFFMLNGLEGGDMSTFIYQKLTLKSTDSITTPFRLTSPKSATRGLNMIIPRSGVLPETKRYEEESIRRGSTYETRRRFGNYDARDEEEEEEEKTVNENTDIVPVIESKLSKLIECIYSHEDTKCTDILLEVSRILRVTTIEQLKPLLQRYIRSEHHTSDVEYRKSEILLDILPTLPNPDAAKVLIELIRERRISEIRGALMIKAMSLLVKPTPTVVKSVFELFKELPKEHETKSPISGRTLLRQATLLAVGTITHRLINVMRSHTKPVPEVITFLETISSEMKRLLEETQSESEKVLVLKSLGNMGSIETMPMLKSIVEDTRMPMKIRVNAVFALRRLAKQVSKQVVPVLMTIYMDTKEVRELRQSAFVVIIEANPSFTTLQMIAHRLRHEPSSQIRTLVYSTLINLAQYESHEPEHKELAKHARLVLKSIPAIPVGIHDSMSVLLNKFSEKFDLGGAINMLKIKSKMSGLPEAIVANLQGTLFGKHRRLLEVGVEGKALEVILRKVFGPHGLLKEILKGKITLRELFKPLSRPDMGGVEHKIRELLNKMMMELRSEESPFSSWYIHLLGNELQYILLNTENVHELVSKVSSFIPELYLKLTQGIKVDLVKAVSSIDSLTLASPMGIPLSLNFTTMSIFKVDGHIKVKNFPTWSELTSRIPTSVPKVKLEVDLKPSVEMTNYITVGVDMRWFASAVGIESHVRTLLPTKFEVHLNGQEHAISTKFYLPKKTVKLHAKISPFTFIKIFPTTVSKLPCTIETKEIINEDVIKVTPFEHKIHCAVSSFELETRGMYSVCGPNWCPKMPLFGKQEITVIARPTTSVEYLHLKIKSLKSNFDIEGVSASHPTEEFYNEEEREEEDENMEDEESRENTKRWETIREKKNYRTSSRSNIESNEFDTITPDQIFVQEPIKRQLLITLEPNTRETPKMRSLITWLMGRRYLKNQFNVQIVRDSHREIPSWKVKLNTVVNPNAIFPETTEATEFLTKSHIFWIVRNEEQEIKIKVIPGSPIDFSRELIEHGLYTADNLPKAKAQKIKYTMEVEVKHIGRKTLRYITLVQDALKFQFYNKLSTAIPHTTQPNKIVVSVELLPWWEEMSVVVKTPREISYIADVPFYWNPFQPTSEKIRMHDMPVSHWYKNRTLIEEEEENEGIRYDTVPYKSAPFYRGECFFNTREMTTFDGVKMSLKPLLTSATKDCWLLVTQDCSNRGLFSLSGKGVPDNWALKVLMPKFDAKFVGIETSISLEVNGATVEISQSRPIVIREERDETSKKLYKLEKLSHGIIELTAFELGVTMVLDNERKTYRTKLSPMSVLNGELCGLCGNNNQDQSDDFEIPSNLKVSRKRNIVHSNLISSETCDVDKITPNEDFCRKESKHVTIRRYDNEVEMKCTTEHKIPQCAEGCRPESTRLIKTCFTCRPEESFSRGGQTYSRKPYVSRWDERTERDEDEEKTDCGDFYQHIDVPTRCVLAY